MKIAIINNGAVVQVGEHRDVFPMTSFAGEPTDDWLAENDCMKVSDTKPFNSRTQKLVQCAPYIEGSLVYTVTVDQQNAQGLNETNESVARMVRLDRNRRLSESDWTQLADAPVNREAWLAYRQALRDIPNQEGFPWEVTWPEEP